MNAGNAKSILELENGYKLKDIKRAYKNKAKKYHPDAGKEASAEKFLLITEAYKFLLDNYQKVPISVSPNIPQKVQKPASKTVNINIRQEDLIEKPFLKISFSVREICKACVNQEVKNITCNYCNGVGYTSNRTPGYMKLCIACEGFGKIPQTNCNICNTKGTLLKDKTISLSTKLFLNKRNPCTIPLTKQGHESRLTDQVGDVILKCKISPINKILYPWIKDIKGRIITISPKIDYLDLLLGGPVTFNLFNKEIKINIPPNSISKDIIKCSLKFPNETTYFLHVEPNITANLLTKGELDLLREIKRKRLP